MRSERGHPYDSRYFARLYGRPSNGGGDAAQAFTDRMRDRLVAQRMWRHISNMGDGSAVLDVGCGYGWLLERFQGAFELYGMDLSDHAVDRARAGLAGATIVRGDIEQGVPFDRRFHAIVAVNVLEHLSNPRGAALAIGRALVRRGIVIVHLPTINGRASRLLYRMLYSQDPTHIYRPSGAGVRALFRSAGLELVEDSFWPYAHHRQLRGLRCHPAYLGVFRRPGRT